jgi:MarR family transcriptional regulator, organic hydroperoxide resistance regulator
MKRTLGTQLRHLIELLDTAVGNSYIEAGLQYRPRYTPLMRALRDSDGLAIGQLAEAAGITQPAATQTVTLMQKDGLVVAAAAGDDARKKVIRLSDAGRDMLPALEQCWAATNTAAAGLEAELPYPLTDLIESAIAALEARPMDARIQDARRTLSKKKGKQ